MENVIQTMSAELQFTNNGGVVPDLYDHRGWRFLPDRAEVDFVVSRTHDSWIPSTLIVSGIVLRKDRGGQSMVRRKCIWIWNAEQGQFTDMRRPAPRWAVDWVKSVNPINNVRFDPSQRD